MDPQNPNQENSSRVPTEAEIARLEAEAAAAMQQDESSEASPRRESPAAPRGFVPYVDDVPEPAPSAKAEEPTPDDDDEPYIPSEMEKRIDAMTPGQWKRWQMLGGGAAGIAIVVCLFGFGQELATYGLILAALLAILLPRYLERSWRRKLDVARLAMIVTLLLGLIFMFILTGVRTGFHFKAQ